MPIAALLVLLLAVPVGLAACGGGDAAEPSSTTAAAAPTSLVPATSTTAAEPEPQTLTLDQLAEFDGKDGRPAYVAVDGVVYDVSGSNMWPEGRHGACNLGAMAGQDLSEEITKAPSSMRALVERLPIVGTLE